VLPLAFSYSATMAAKEASSSRTKPWVHHTLAVLAAALAMKGRPRVPAAARATDPCRTERLLSLLMPILPCFHLGRARSLRGPTCWLFVGMSDARPASVANTAARFERVARALCWLSYRRGPSVAMQPCGKLPC